MEIQTEDEKVKSLKINKPEYHTLLEKYLHHDSYLNTFHSTQTATSCNNGPERADISLKKSNLHVSLPYPLGEPYSIASTEDECFKLLKQKRDYAAKIRTMKASYKHDKKWLTRSLFKNQKYPVLPEYFLELTTGSVQDPDPLFNSDYDYYYTGGLLAQVTINLNNYLVRPVAANKLCLTNENITIPVKLDDNLDRIYNIKASGNKICIRRKNHFSYYELVQKKKKVKALKLWETSDASTPFIDVQAYNTEKIAYTNVKGVFKITDVENNAVVLTHQFTPELVGLAQFQYLHKNVFLYMNESSVRTFDKRSLDENSFTIEKGFFSCNNLCNLCVSSTNNNNIYINSRHHTYMFDIRQSKTVTKQPHFLTLPPIVCRAQMFMNNEIVGVTSFSETVCFQMEFMENYLPFKLLNANATLHECCLKKQLVLNDSVEGRIGLSSAGMVMRSKTNEDITLYTTNTLGDIFCSNISQTSTDMDLVLTEFVSWSELFPNDLQPLKITSMREMSGFPGMLIKPTKTKKLTKYTRPNPYLQRFQNTIAKISQLDMAAIWSDDKLEVIDDRDPSNKVEDWLRSTEAEAEDVKDFEIGIDLDYP